MAITSAAAAACPSCFFEVVSLTTLVFPFTLVKTIEVSVIPHVTVYSNGSQITSNQTITESATDFVGSGTGSSATHIFTDPNQLTWTVGDATLTSPTTYVQYLAFEGALMTSESGSYCAQPSPTTLTLPSSTDAASFIYPLALAATGFPTPFLNYLATVPEVSSQFHGAALTGCSSPTYKEVGTYAGAPLSSTPSSTRSPYRNSTSSSGSSSFGKLSRSHLTTKVPPKTKVSVPPAISTKTTTGGHPHPDKPPPPVQQSATTPVQTFTTATVLNTVVGPASYTTVGGPKPHNTKTQPITLKPGVEATTQKTSPGSPARTSPDSNNPSPKPGHGAGTSRPGKGGSQGTPTVYHAGSSKVTANSGGGVVIGTKTIQPGETATIGSGSAKTTVVVPSQGSKIIINSQTFTAEPGITANPKALKPLVSSGVVVTNGHSITIIKSKHSIIVQDGSTRTTIPPGSVVTFEGQTISAPKRKGSPVVVNGHSAPLTAASQAVFTTKGHTFTAVDLGSSVVVADGTSTITIKDGKQTTFDGQIFSVGESGSAVVINHKTMTMSAGTASISEAVITVDGHTITAIEKDGSMILVDATSTATVKGSNAITFEGQKISAAKSGTAVVVDGTTYQMTLGTTDINGYITKGLGGPSATATTSAVINSAAAAAGLPACFLLLLFTILSSLCLMAIL